MIALAFRRSRPDHVVEVVRHADKNTFPALAQPRRELAWIDIHRDLNFVIDASEFGLCARHNELGVVHGSVVPTMNGTSR